MISLTDLVSEAFRPAARNKGLRPVRQADILSAFGSAAAECNSAGRTDLVVYVPNLVHRANLICAAHVALGSARVSRVGDRLLAIADFSRKIVSARRRKSEPDRRYTRDACATRNYLAASELTRDDSSAIEKSCCVASSVSTLAPFASAFRGGVIFIPTSLLTPRSSMVTP